MKVRRGRRVGEGKCEREGEMDKWERLGARRW